MLTLNILPKQNKREIKLLYIYKNLKKIMLLLVLYISVLATAILVARLFLQINFINLSQNLNILVAENQTSISHLKMVSSKLNYISKIQKDNIKVSDLLADLTNKINDGIKINQIKFDHSKNSLNINGRAKTRDDLLNFKQNLENSPNYTDIKFPLKNILEKENIDFNIELTIKSYEF